jgi:hypothetical protein
MDEIERSLDDELDSSTTLRWADPNIREVILPRRMRDSREDVGDITVSSSTLPLSNGSSSGGGGGPSNHVTHLLGELAEVESTLGPERALAKRFTFDDPNPYTKGTRVYYIEEAEREARESLTQWSLSHKYSPEDLLKLQITKTKLLAVIEDLILALNDCILDLTLATCKAELAPHAEIFRALKAALPSLKGLVQVVQSPLASSGDTEVGRGIAILRVGFQWHQEALRQVRSRVQRPEALSEELAPLIGTLKIYSSSLNARTS